MLELTCTISTQLVLSYSSLLILARECRRNTIRFQRTYLWNCDLPLFRYAKARSSTSKTTLNRAAATARQQDSINSHHTPPVLMRLLKRLFFQVMLSHQQLQMATLSCTPVAFGHFQHHAPPPLQLSRTFGSQSGVWWGEEGAVLRKLLPRLHPWCCMAAALPSFVASVRARKL